MIQEFNYHLNRDVFGKLLCTNLDDQSQKSVVPILTFPITAPNEGISLIDSQGHELVWINNLDELSNELRILIEEELANREFMPEIKYIYEVSNLTTPNVWQVETDLGKTSFILKGEEDIRHLTSMTLVITDSHGICLLIRNRSALDSHSRKILDHFL